MRYRQNTFATRMWVAGDVRGEEWGVRSEKWGWEPIKAGRNRVYLKAAANDKSTFVANFEFLHSGPKRL